MAGGGHVKLPDGSVIVALSVPPPAAPGAPWPRPGDGTERRVRVLVRARNRARALTRLRNAGFRSVYLRGNTAPPTPDEITAVLHHPEGLLWRASLEDDTESWHPVAALRQPPAR